jgi:hypothetical protein
LLRLCTPFPSTQVVRPHELDLEETLRLISARLSPTTVALCCRAQRPCL